MVFVTVSETYDLSTKVNKMSLIGIHTPTKDIIQKTYPGLCMNSKYVRIVKQDVVMACASMLPADPLQIGVETGDIAPQDMFNPILYKAVSNDSFSTLEARLAGLQYDAIGKVIDGQSVIKTDDPTGLADDFGVYYALLSNRDGFKTAAPQQGLRVSGLVPLVFEKYYNYGVNQINYPTTSENEFNAERLRADGSLEIVRGHAQAMRGKAHPMPRINTTYLTSQTSGSGVPGWQFNGMGSGVPGSGAPTNNQVEMPDIMPVYTMAIVMPPCKLNQLFYRLVVRTTLEFTEVRPIQEITAFSQMDSNYAPLVYATDYAEQSKAMTSKLGMVDGVDANLEKIMEGR